MTDTEQEAIERLWRRASERLPPSERSFDSFVAGYLAGQKAVAQVGPKCAVCNGTGVDENLDPVKLDMVARVLERADELDREARDEREHLEKAARHFYEAGVEMLEVEGFVPKPELKAWLERERLRRSKQEGSG